MLNTDLLPSGDKIAPEPPDQAGSLQEHGDEHVDAEADAIGLIGHFEAKELLAHKGKEGLFVGSLDMSMTTRELMSTSAGVGKRLL